ncbi:hypothetical protein C0J52_16284 [Blattella germanica]|nr:hypothetical protein C0J52_16284 [Blattella germanica]
MFPSLKNPEHVSARLKNVAHEVYICVKTDEAGKNTLSTKTRNLDLDSDPELEFSLYYYTSAEANETKMVIPVHEATKTCLRTDSNFYLTVTDDNMLDIKENAGSDYPEDILFSLDQTG